MRLALLADIHANAAALEAVLLRVRNLGADQLVFLGDLVGYGPDPVQVTERVAECVDRGALAIKGNHDAAAAGQRSDMNATAQAAIDWTRRQLSPDHVTFLSALAMEHVNDEVHFVHADASAPASWNYVTDTETAKHCLAAARAPVVFCGHVHVPQLYCTSTPGRVVAHRPGEDVAMPLLQSRTWLAVVGSVGQPRDRNPAASFCIYDTRLRQLNYHRAPYDVAAVSQKILLAGLPERLAERLLEGR